MTTKNNFQCSMRDYVPSDQPAVVALFRNGILEHVYPAFFRSLGHPDHVGVALSLCMAGYVLGGSSYFQALLFGSAWAGLIYYCCHEIYEGYMLRRLGTDMADVGAVYLENPDNGFWVAEAEVNGKTRVVGTVAVMGKEDGGGADWNGAAVGAEREAGGRYGELPHVVVSFACRHKGLGTQLTQKALDFCKQRGYTRLVVRVGSPQTAALSLFRKLGFVQTASHGDTHGNRWLSKLVSKLARINVMTMEKSL